jgi:epoxyqueuosine reductase
MAGSAIYRIGYAQWLRNIAVGLGNARKTPQIMTALKSRENDVNALVREHVRWALNNIKN